MRIRHRHPIFEFRFSIFQFPKRLAALNNGPEGKARRMNTQRGHLIFAFRISLFAFLVSVH
jgi:hypothetical protein